LVRERVAKFITQRDGYECQANDIFLTAGASSGVESVLETIIANSNVGVMIPIPQYPLYTATITMKDGIAVPYHLDEDDMWGLTTDELEGAITKMYIIS
jgi:alanine transaminase